jgi:cellulase
MDIWEANSISNAMTPHTCSSSGSFLCSGSECNTTVGVCDKSGCGVNPYAFGDKTFYGPNLAVNTSQPFTVVTQFLGDNSTDATQAVREIRRIYVQDGHAFQSPGVTVNNKADNSKAAFDGTVTDAFCQARNASDFVRLGGMTAMGDSLNRGMVLIFSIWDSAGDNMTWLDSGDAGPCTKGEGNPANILENNPETSVTFSNIRWGDIGTTFNTSGPGGNSSSGRIISSTETAGSGRATVLAAGFAVGLAAWTGVILA